VTKSREEELNDVPFMPPDKKTWDKGIRPIALAEIDSLGLDVNGNLYWQGKKVKTVETIELTVWQNTIAVIATVATVVQAIVAVAEYLKP
jgi:hypothetical protein